MIPTIIDCDPGNGIPGANVDDGLAIALALGAADRIDLRAVTVVAGNTPVDRGSGVARWLLPPGSGVPVHRGAERALLEDPGPWREHLDRSSDRELVDELWRGVPGPGASAGPDAGGPAGSEAGEHAAVALARIVGESPGAVTVVALGPLTNLALAMRLSPSFAEDVARIVVMGGAFDVDGYRADTNFALDPEAARIVLRSGADITLVPLDVTTTTLLRPSDLEAWPTDSPMAERIAATTRPWLRYSAAVRGLDGCWLHDVLAVALLADPAVVSTRRYRVDVEVAEGAGRGHSLRWGAGAGQARPDSARVPGGEVDVVVSADNARLLAALRDGLARLGHLG